QRSGGRQGAQLVKNFTVINFYRVFLRLPRVDCENFHSFPPTVGQSRLGSRLNWGALGKLRCRVAEIRQFGWQGWQIAQRERSSGDNRRGDVDGEVITTATRECIARKGGSDSRKR